MTETSGCGSGGERARARRLSVGDARRRILEQIVAVRGTEKVALRAALGRVAARDIVSPIDVPAHTNAAVDGYAVAAAALPRAGTKEFRVVGTALAGRPFAGAIGRDECVHVMTGAPMPAGTDAVIFQEQARCAGDRIAVEADVRRERNVRAAGEDLARGGVALPAGKRIGPAELGLVASLGLPEVPVYRRPRVAFFSTGDELRALGEPLGPGLIYDSNRYTLYGMLTALGVELLDMGVVPDDAACVERAFTDASTLADAVISTGGVSVGEADYIKQTLAALGAVDFWQVAMRPGRPFAFGRLGAAAFFGLPGNPVAVMVTFYQFVQPALRRLMGEAPPGPPPTFRARSLSRLKTRIGRTELIRGVFERDPQGALVVCSTGSQGSGILSSMSAANCFIVLPPESAGAEPGDDVDVLPFAGLV